MSTLKQQNRGWIVLFVAIHVVGFAWISSGEAFPSDWEKRIAAITRSVVLSGSITVAAIIISGFLGDKVKAALVFWRVKNPLPGTRAFSEIARNDPRISLDRLLAQTGDFPNDPVKQNQLWYRIYREHKDEPSVLDAHGNYLLARELSWLSVVFLIALPPLFLVLGGERVTALFYALSLLVSYIIVAVAGRHFGMRLVANVLAIESARAPNESSNI